MADDRTPLKRPAFFDDPAVDILLSICTELACEVSVLKDRQQALELYLENRGALDRADFAAFAPAPADQQAMDTARAALITRLFRAVEAQS